MKSKEVNMPRVSINSPAPDFELQDYKGKTVRLSDYKGESNVILIFNRTFA
jgi:peroxiredoxin